MSAYDLSAFGLPREDGPAPSRPASGGRVLAGGLALNALILVVLVLGTLLTAGLHGAHAAGLPPFLCHLG